jgi:hypothetical protein
MKQQQSIIKIIFIIMFFVLSINSVNADVGPKSSVNIKISGIEEKYFVTLLSDTEVSGPYSNKYPYTGKELDYTMFEDYSDEFYFLYNVKELSGEGTYSWTYFPPENFKVLVYIPSTNHYIESKELESFAFHTYYNLNVKDYEILNISKNYVTGFTLYDFLLRLLLTLLIEVTIALFFKFKGYELKVIVITNLITQTLLILILMILNYKIGYFGEALIMLPLELVVLVIELLIYNKYLESCKHPAIYAVVANIASFLVGMYLLMYFLI